MLQTIQDSDIIPINFARDGIFKMCNESLIFMAIETFDRLRSGLNSFHGELLLVDHHTKGSEHI